MIRNFTLLHATSDRYYYDQPEFDAVEVKEEPWWAIVTFYDKAWPLKAAYGRKT